jgi:hypothetical protein
MRILTVFVITVVCLFRTSSLSQLNNCKKLIKSKKLTLKSSLSDTEVFIPPIVGSEIYIGSVVSLIPIIWATYEFNSRIQTQRKCLLCNGSGLVMITKSGNKLSRPRKCWSCGGFLPWLGWKMFFFSSFFDIGNGGVLQRPSQDYQQINENIEKGLLNREVIESNNSSSATTDESL